MPAGATAILGLFAAVPSQREGPIYNGRHLSEWVQMYGSFYSVRGGDHFDAEEAIAAAGTNAIPFLLKWIQHEDKYVQDKLLAPLPPLISERRFYRLATSPATARAEGSMQARQMFSTNIGPEVAMELTRLTNNRAAPQTANRASQILSKLDPQGLPALAAVLQDSEHPARHMAVWSMYILRFNGNLDPSAKILVPG